MNVPAGGGVHHGAPALAKGGRMDGRKPKSAPDDDRIETEVEVEVEVEEEGFEGAVAAGGGGGSSDVEPVVRTMFHSISLDESTSNTDFSPSLNLVAKSPPTMMKHAQPRHQTSLTMDPSSPKTSEFDP